MAAKNKSKWWIVSTHVLTSGFSLPLLSQIVGGLLTGVLGLKGMHAFLFRLTILVVGYICGTYYSLRYLKKKAITNDWQGCITPAFISFLFLIIIGFIVNFVFSTKSFSIVLSLVVFYCLVLAAFEKITSNGFLKFQASMRKDIHTSHVTPKDAKNRGTNFPRWFSE